MVVWVALAVLLALTLLVLLRPIFNPAAEGEGGDDREVYTAQLDELAADRERGLIGEEEAAAARAEIARRLLRARDGRALGAASHRRGLVAAVTVAIFVPAFSLGAYLFLGAPDYADQPLAARIAPTSEEELRQLVARAEARLAENPDDGRGWLAVAPVYQRLGRHEDAARAFARVNALLGETPEWLTAQAESLAFANEGRVPPEAERLFRRALELEPTAVRPAIFLAISARQSGDFLEAGERWRSLLARSRGDEPWLEIATAEFMRMGLPVDGEAPPPGSAPVRNGEASPEAGGGRPAGAPPAMVEAMVASLAGRLASEGGTAQDWVRLVRSYTVLGREEKARQAVEDGLAALEGEALDAFTAAPDVREYLQ